MSLRAPRLPVILEAVTATRQLWRGQEVVITQSPLTTPDTLIRTATWPAGRSAGTVVVAKVVYQGGGAAVVLGGVAVVVVVVF